MNTKNTIIEFEKEEDISEFIKCLLKSKNGKDCFVELGHTGNDYYVELKNEYSSDILST